MTQPPFLMGGGVRQALDNAGDDDRPIGVPLEISLKALFLQCMWNNKTLQGPGFAWAVSASRTPGIAALMARHMGYFNATPALAPCLAAAVVRMEEKGAGESQIAKVKESAAGPLAAVGDQLFWSTLRPLAALAGLVGSFLGPVVAAILVVSVYNVPQGFFRVYGAVRGYGEGVRGVTACVQVARRFTVAGRPAAAVLLGFLAGAVLLGFGDRYGTGGELITVGAGAGMAWLLMSCRVSSEQICVAILVLSGVLSLVLGG